MRQNKKNTNDLSKEEFLLFREIITLIDLKDIYLNSMAFKRNENIPGSNEISVSIKESDMKTDIKDNIFKADISFFINLSDKTSEVIFLESQFNYTIIFSLKNKEDSTKIVEILQNKKVSRFFSEMQLTKIVWPFVREEFNSILFKSGLQRITLPLLK